MIDLSSAGIPDDADEILEIVDEEAGPPQAVPSPSPTPTPTPAPRPIQASYPEEALREIKNLREQIDRKDKQIEQVMEAYRGKKAETEKLRGRIEKTERKRFEQSKGDFIARFVEVLDNLDRAIDSIENAFDPDSVLQGIMLVRSRLVQLLKEEGLEKIFVRGQSFDPTHSEAAEMEAVNEEGNDGVVLKELQPGYMLKGSLLRVARVVVGRYAPDASEASTAAVPAVEPRSPAPSPRPAPPATPEATGSDSEDSNEKPQGEADGDDSGSWEAGDASGHELEFSEDGLDFSK